MKFQSTRIQSFWSCSIVIIYSKCYLFDLGYLTLSLCSALHRRASRREEEGERVLSTKLGNGLPNDID